MTTIVIQSPKRSDHTADSEEDPEKTVSTEQQIETAKKSMDKIYQEIDEHFKIKKVLKSMEFSCANL